MGVITKLLYRGQDLQVAPFRNLFVDMEENIHIHYRDLRIELSRLEFEDIVKTFTTQSKELLAIIHEKNYEDGKIPNSNQEDVRIWTDSRLPTPVKYHPQRISIEECTDGYHLHLRNYKFLFSHEDFKSFYNAILSIDLNQAYAKTGDEILQLFEDNEMDFVVKKYNQQDNTISIIAAQYHVSKIRTICEKIGMIKSGTSKNYQFKNDNVTIDVLSGSKSLVYQTRKSQSLKSSSLLVAYLLNNSIDNDTLNHIKTQALELFSYAKQCEKTPDVDLNYLNWTYDTFTKTVNFPFKITPQNLSFDEIRNLYRQWSNFQKEHDLFFVKPTKVIFDKDKQLDTQGRVFSEIMRTLAVINGVSKIYVMGSVIRGDMGIYKSPFIHSEWAKLGSDIDIVIEMEHKDSVIPENWEYINVSTSNSCDIYHLSQVKLEDEFGFEKQFPHVKYFHHLLDAYVYIPGKSNLELKDKFLKRFGARLLYSKNNADILDIEFKEEIQEQVIENSEDGEPKTHQNIQRHIHFNKKLPENKKNDNSQDLSVISNTLLSKYSFKANNLQKMKEATENELYHFDADKNTYVLKCYKVSGNYNSSRILEHAEYEAGFVSLIEKHIDTAHLVKDNSNHSLIDFNGTPAILYTYEPGRIYKYPDPLFPIDEATRVLAELHKLQFDQELSLPKNFSYDDVYQIWYPEFNRFLKETLNDGELAHDFSKLKEIYKNMAYYYKNVTENKKIPWIHNHGDVTPRNFIIRDAKAILIDFQNAFFGPRILDIIDGAYEFSFGGKPPGKDDFRRFDEFINTYQKYSPLKDEEKKVLKDAVVVSGIIKFLKEVRMIKGSTNKKNSRRLRALSVSQFLLDYYS